jgi:hypothetical protein
MLCSLKIANFLCKFCLRSNYASRPSSGTGSRCIICSKIQYLIVSIFSAFLDSMGNAGSLSENSTPQELVDALGDGFNLFKPDILSYDITGAFIFTLTPKDIDELLELFHTMPNVLKNLLRHHIMSLLQRNGRLNQSIRSLQPLFPSRTPTHSSLSSNTPSPLHCANIIETDTEDIDNGPSFGN